MNASSIYESYEERKRLQNAIPPNDFLPWISPTATWAGATQLEQLNRNQGIPKVAPLWVVHSEGRILKTSRPITVNVFRDGDIFFAENETLLVCGTGDSAWDAVEDLEMHIFHFWKYYNGLPEDSVIGEAKRLKNQYKNLLIEE